MEKKTIGGFIAALRKANGITQKELAERLNVSDKTVSRWERDDGAPDLSLIPVIAEIFDITCDELLRGERKSPTARVELSTGNVTSIKGEKQRQRLLKASLSQYQNLTCISIGVSVVGFIVSLICNFAILSAILGALIGAIFFATSIVLQVVFVNKAFLSVEDAELDAESLSRFKRNVIRFAEKSIGLTVIFIGFTSPLILVDAFWGLSSDSLLIWGSIGAAAFLLIYAIILYFLNDSFLKKGIYYLSEKEKSVYQHNRQLKGKYSLRIALILVITLLFHGFGSNAIWSSYNLSSSYGITFNDYESFIEYMEQDISSTLYETHFNESITVTAPLESTGEVIYYDEFGNEISEEEALTETIEDADGKVLCTYIHRNNSVSDIRYEPHDGTALPIQVITYEDYWAARSLSNMINVIYSALYPIEILAVLLIYFKKRIKAVTP